MLSRAHIARDDETSRFSTTNTLSDFPLLIGESYIEAISAQREERDGELAYGR
jgi:hypothetical protein